MRIYRFYPEDYARQYFVARDADDAKTKREDCWAAYFGENLTDMFAEPLDEYDTARLAGLRATFDEGFAKLEETPLTFVDSHY